MHRPKFFAVAFAILLLQACTQRLAEDYSGWKMYGGNAQNNHYSSLTQIDTSNVAQLVPAWEYHTGDADSNTQITANPIVVNGVLYGISAGLKLFALDAASGKQLWAFNPLDTTLVNASAASYHGMNVCRGLSWYQNKSGEGRLFYSVSSTLYCIRADNGIPANEFGNYGKVDLHNDLGRNVNDLYIASTTPPMVYQGLVIVGSRVNEALPSAPGHIRAYDAHTGKLRWRFNTIPQQNEAGIETWPNASVTAYTGGANAWAGFSLDEKAGILFAPTGSAAFDFYGGNRAGNNLYANCVLALDAATGKKRWHYQTVHHDVWDRDLPTAPIPIRMQHKGSLQSMVVQVTKSGFVFVLSGETGEPIYAVNEVAVPDSPRVDGEMLSPTQPIPTHIKPFARQSLSESDIDSLLPQAERDAIKKQLRGLSRGSIFTPPSLRGTLMYPGFDGGAEWGGAAYDPQTNLLYVNANEMPWILTIVKKNRQHTSRETNLQAGIRLYQGYCMSCHAADRNGSGDNPSLLQAGEKLSIEEFRQLLRNGRRMMPAQSHLTTQEQTALASWILGLPDLQNEKFTGTRKADPTDSLVPYTSTGYNKWLSSNGTAITNPPWGTLTAINLQTGQHEWRIPLGSRYDLAAKGYSNTGTENYGGPVVTAGGLVFIAASSDGMFRAFNKRSGKLVWQFKLPAAAFATPAVYEVNGKQYVVVACGGKRLGTPTGDSYIAFALEEKARN